MRYRELQKKVASLRERGLVEQILKLNSSQEVLAKAYRDYLSREERNQVSNNPLLIIWLVAVFLAAAIILVCLTSILAAVTIKSFIRISQYLVHKVLCDRIIIRLRDKLRSIFVWQGLMTEPKYTPRHKPLQ